MVGTALGAGPLVRPLIAGRVVGSSRRRSSGQGASGWTRLTTPGAIGPVGARWDQRDRTLDPAVGLVADLADALLLHARMLVTDQGAGGALRPRGSRRHDTARATLHRRSPANLRNAGGLRQCGPRRSGTSSMPAGPAHHRRTLPLNTAASPRPRLPRRRPVRRPGRGPGAAPGVDGNARS